MAKPRGVNAIITAPLMGRPTNYRPEMCEEVVELAKLGKSYEQIASTMGYSLRSFYEWRDIYPNFANAMEDAKQFEQQWWEDQAQAYMLEHKDSAKLNTGLWTRSMAARFPKKYREATKTEISGAVGAQLIPNIAISFVKPE